MKLWSIVVKLLSISNIVKLGNKSRNSLQRQFIIEFRLHNYVNNQMQTCHPKIQVENNQNLPLQCKFRELEFIQNQQIWEIHNSINIRPQRFAVRLWLKKITPFLLFNSGRWLVALETVFRLHGHLWQSFPHIYPAL